jgi:hypothetical protein
MIRFADRSFYLAVVNPHDPAHAAAVAMAREFRPANTGPLPTASRRRDERTMGLPRH